ncbi:hypothetical protein K440DRAFT_661562 [Wilcoxina mikolae CBS 423.85]|nr:hypothetical protein K440DRAFT_661562 [Wilcoxina mikolae CBS 423.85]
MAMKASTAPTPMPAAPPVVSLLPLVPGPLVLEAAVVTGEDEDEDEEEVGVAVGKETIKLPNKVGVADPDAVSNFAVKSSMYFSQHPGRCRATPFFRKVWASDEGTSAVMVRAARIVA